PRLDARALVAAVVGLSFAVRLVLAWARATPVYFPDEYIYTAIGRSLAEGGAPAVRDAGLHFPALLQPLLTAPAWLVQDPALSFRLVQGLGALAMSLAAVPVYLLARRIGIGSRLAVGLGVLAVALPDLLYSSWLVAEPFAYPLVLGSVAAGVVALAEPSRRAHAAFIALAVLATLARLQFGVIPLCFVAAALLLGLRERRLRTVLREQRLPLGVFALAAVLGVGVGRGALGVYGTAVLHPHLDAGEVLSSAGANLLVLAYSSGWLLVPGAAVGLALALARPRCRAELAFALLAATLGLALLLQASLYGDVQLVQERYLFYLVPLATLAFGLYASRGWPLRLWHTLAAAVLVTASAAVPLAGYAANTGKTHSPFLFGVFELEQRVGNPGAGSGILAGLAVLLSLTAVGLSRRPGVATPVAVGLAACACLSAYVAAVSFDLRNTDAVARSFVPAERSWVDRAAAGDVALVRAQGGNRTEAMGQLFWNRSVRSVLLLPGAEPLDAFGHEWISIGRDGSLSERGRPLAGPLLVDGFASSVILAGARVLDRSQASSLWQPRGDARLSVYLRGRHHDGWLADRGAVAVWSPGTRVAGRLRLTLTALRAAGTVTLSFRLRPGAAPVAVRLLPEVPRTVDLPICSAGAWQGEFWADVTGTVDGRRVSVRASEPRFVESPGACA
ncbi:MAG: hypothetical protein ABR521_14710, partial [Gaiellaceae bacterium]